MKISATENALLVRTAFADQKAWDNLLAAARNPEGLGIFNLEVLDDPANSGVTVEQLLELIDETYPHSFLVVVDDVALSGPGHPLLVVDLMEERGRQFRAAASHVAEVDNNLSIANMGFAEFAEAVDASGVYRGFPEV